ncbi:MAG: hypothetical protein SFU86_16280 [Pirellulaceae bacterium]|nr:hypothetical protein [Pirellulaceae bacterium]
MNTLLARVAHRTNRFVKRPNLLFVVVLSISIGVGHTLLRVLTGNLSTLPGLVLGAAATALLALGLSLVFSTVANWEDSPARRQS